MHFLDLLQSGRQRSQNEDMFLYHSTCKASCPISHREGGLWEAEPAYLSPGASSGGYDSGLAQRPASSARDIVM